MAAGSGWRPAKARRCFKGLPVHHDNRDMAPVCLLARRRLYWAKQISSADIGRARIGAARRISGCLATSFELVCLCLYVNLYGRLPDIISLIVLGLAAHSNLGYHLINSRPSRRASSKFRQLCRKPDKISRVSAASVRRRELPQWHCSHHISCQEVANSLGQRLAVNLQ